MTTYGRRVRVNPIGQADLDGFVHVGHIPMYLCIEAKVGKDKLKQTQKLRQEAYHNLGVIYHVVRDLTFDDDMDALYDKIESYGYTEGVQAHTTKSGDK